MKKALVIVDMQHDFISGSLGCESAQAIVTAVVRKIDYCRQNGYELFFTRDIHEPDYLGTQEGRNLPIVHCQAGEAGCEIITELLQYQDEQSIIIDKSGFGSLELAERLQQGKYDVVEVCGLVSNICVLFAAVLAKSALPEAEIIVDETCTSSFDSSLHAKSLDVLVGMQVKVLRGAINS